MKKAYPLIIVVVVLVIALVVSFVYKNNKIKNAVDSTERPSITMKDESKELTDDDIIAKTDDGAYKLYYKNKTATITYKDAKLEFFTWDRAIELEKPTIYYADFDHDTKKELIIRLIDEYNDVKTSETTYSLILIRPEKVDGKTELTYLTAQPSLWKTTFSNAVKEELNQLKYTNKYIQYTMTNPGKKIEYDPETGISNGRYVGYAKTDCDSKKNYYTVISYFKGAGIYKIDSDNTMTLDIQLFVKYDEVDGDYQIGNIHCDIIVDKLHFYIQPYSITFIPLKEYEIIPPTDVADADWDYKITNSVKDSIARKILETFDATFTINQNTDGEELEIKRICGTMSNVKTVEFNQEEVAIVLKDNCSFAGKKIDEGKFAVLIKDRTIDISDKAQIINDKLIIKFDKTYNKKDLETVTVTFG